MTTTPLFAQQLGLITQHNRNYEGADPMHGGWGPHLRSVMQAPDGSLWFSTDSGPDVKHNDAILYHKLVDGSWNPIGTNSLTANGGRIQQNTAHILVGRTILSYGVDVDRGRLVECYFDTLDPSYKACNDVWIGSQPYAVPDRSNYVGAAVSPGGFRIVWFTSTGNPGQLVHLWNFGSGWNGPVTTPVHISGNNYEYAAYLRPIFSSNNTVELIGEVGIDDVLFLAAHVSITIANHYPRAQMSWLGPLDLAYAPKDIWVDDADGLHAITGSSSNVGSYFYKAPGGVWHYHSESGLPGLTEARFQHIAATDTLYLLSNEGPSALLLRRGSVAGHTGPLDFGAFTAVPIPSPSGTNLTSPPAIYNMARAYQTTAVQNLNFAIVGTNPTFDHQIFHLHG
ncbi:MAG: hypothetical protein AAGD38_17970 [Acidobacteriota bacterium]